MLIAYLENEADRAAIRRLGNSPSLMLASTPPDFADRVDEQSFRGMVAESLRRRVAIQVQRWRL